jgi:putative endonuclease
MPFAYILKSLKDQKYYYGSTKDLEQRLQSHNKGKVRSTKGRCPLILHYSEEFNNIQEARKREIYFKSIDGYFRLKGQGII